MKKNLTLLLALFLSVGVAYEASAQTVIYTQNFDSSATLPTGWYASANSWYVDTTLGNVSSGYPAASGVNNIVIKDTTAALGNDSLITGAISTVGYDSIMVDWGTRFSKHFADSGSSVSLYYSTNGTTWTNVSYIENANTSAWALDNDSTPILLPAGAAQQASLRLMWVADIHFTPSGTYRIDDLIVTGSVDTTHTDTTGIAGISAEDAFAKVYANGHSTINISLLHSLTGNTMINIYDAAGRLVSETNMSAQAITIDAEKFSAGLYLVRVSDQDHSSVTKVVIR